MSDFRPVEGFEEVWRPVAKPRPRLTRSIIASAGRQKSGGAGARLARIVAGAPEAVVSVTGRPRNRPDLLRHLNYIGRDGEVGLEDRDGVKFLGRPALSELVRDWATADRFDSHRRVHSPLGQSIVLSMPPGTARSPFHAAAREFGQEAFGQNFDYVFARHDDTPNPHVHLTVRSLGDDGRRLHPMKADLAAWRELFASVLRDHGVEAEATLRRTRGVTLKTERWIVRRLRILHEAGRRELPRLLQDSYLRAAEAAFGGDTSVTPWELRMVQRQARIRSLYLAQAQALLRSQDPSDRNLGRAVEKFVADMPSPDSQRLKLARELRAANNQLKVRQLEQGLQPERSGSDRDRGR